jgi:hypothetical protein
MAIRGELKGLKETVEKNQGVVSPAIEEWKRIKTLGVGISGLIALAGLTIGGIVAYMSETAVSGIRHWLKIRDTNGGTLRPRRTDVTVNGKRSPGRLIIA